MIRNDNDQRRVFLAMPRNEQLAMLYDMIAYNRNELATDKSDHVAMKDDIKFMKNELIGIGMRGKDDTLTTTQKFDAKFEKRAAWFIWYRDRVLAPTLSAVHTLIIMAVLYLAFGGKLP
jgi:hypothetical protein